MAKTTYYTYTPKTYSTTSGFNTKNSSSGSSAATQANNLTTRLNAVGVDTDTRNPLEKLLNLTPDQNFIFDIFELIDRPGQAVRNAIAPEQDTGNVLTNALAGLTGEQKTSGSDLIDRTLGTVSEDASLGEKALHGALGFGAEILLDPLNWVGVGLADDVVRGAGNVADVAKAADKAQDASKLIFGFNKGQDLLGYGLKNTVGKAGSTALDFAKKTAPEATDAVSQSWKALSKLWEAPLGRLSNLKDDAVTKIKSAIGLTKEGDYEISRIINKFGEDFANDIKPLMSDPDVLDTLMSYAEREMPDLFSKIENNVLSDKQIKEIFSQMLLSKSGSNVVNRNFDELLDKLIRNGDVVVTAKAGSVDEPMQNFVKVLQDLIGEDNVSVGSQLGSDYRRVSVTPEYQKILSDSWNDIIDKASEDGYSVRDYINNLSNVDWDTSFDAVSDSLEDILGSSAGAEKILTTINPYANVYQNVSGRIRDILESVGFDVDKIDNYIRNELTEEGKEAIRLRGSTNSGSSLGYTNNVNGAGLSVKGLNKNNFINRSYYGNPVDTNRTMREIMGIDTPVFVTDPFSLLDITRNKYLGEAENQVLRTEIVDILSKSIKDGVDNGVIVSTKVKSLFPDIKLKESSVGGFRKAANNFINANQNEIGDWLLKTVGTNDVNAETIQQGISFAQTLGESVPDVVTEALERLNKYTQSLSDLANSKRQVLMDMGIRNAEILNDAKVTSRFKNLKPYEVESFIEQNALNSGMKKYGNISELLDKMGFESAFGDTSEVNKQISQIKNYIGNKPVYLDSTVAGMLERTPKLNKEMNELVKLYNGYMNAWKGAKLTSVGFPFRNLFGDSTNLIVAGMPAKDVVSGLTKSASQLADLKKIQDVIDDNVIKKGAEFIMDGLSKDQIKLYNTWQDFVKTGMAAQTRTVDEVKDLMLYITGDGGYTGLNVVKNNPTVKKALESVYNLSTSFDVMNRFSAYQWANTEKGLKTILENGYKSADDFVRSALFDYSDLSKFENSVMRKIFPFYTFMRKNTEFHLKNFGKNARRYSQIYDLAKNLYESNGISEGDLPDYVSESLQIPIGETEDGKIRYLKLNPSFIEAFQLPSNLASGLNPLIRTPLEMASGVQLFTGREDDRSFPEKLTDLIPYPQAARPIVESLASGIDLLGQGNVSGAGQAIMSPLEDIPSLAYDLTLGSLIGETNPETNQYYYLQDLIDSLTEKKKQYESTTGQSLPTLDDLGL